jgi:hypothetical protein
MSEPARKKRGRKPLAEDEIRSFRVAAWLTREEAQHLDEKRGRKAKGEWLREAAFGAAVAVPPKINMQVWASLGHGLSNLNQIARHLNSGRSIEQKALETEISAIRDKLLGIAE